MKKPVITLPILFAALLLSGCANKALEKENADLKVELQQEQESQQQLRQDYADKLKQVESLSASEKRIARSEMAELRRDLNSAMRENKVQVQKIDDLTVIELEQTTLFPSGQIDLTGEGKQVVRQLVEAFNRYPGYNMRIEGHTDSLPLSEALQADYISNWELSAMRAAKVAKYMIYGLEVPKERISIAGYADTRPVADNATKEGRDNNRRIRAVMYKNIP